MKSIGFVLLLASSALVGCAGTTYLYRIPDTPDALAAYRQCMTVPHLENFGPCLAGIPGQTRSVLQAGEDDRNYKAAVLASGLNCRKLADYVSSSGDQLIIQACEDANVPEAKAAKDTLPGTYKDAAGEVHLKK